MARLGKASACQIRSGNIPALASHLDTVKDSGHGLAGHRVGMKTSGARGTLRAGGGQQLGYFLVLRARKECEWGAGRHRRLSLPLGKHAQQNL